METTNLERSVLRSISDNRKEHDHRIRDIKAENNSSFRQGAGNKLKLWGIWRANCAGNCAGLRYVVTKKRSLLSQENDNFASISDKIKNASYRSSNHTEVFAKP